MKKRVIICISREYGSGGKEVGDKLSALLGIPSYDKELLVRAAIEHSVAEESLTAVDELPATWSSMGFPRGIRNPYKIHFDHDSFYVINDKVFHMLAETIQNLAAEGSCIIVGRAAEEVLKDDPDMVSIFIHAKLDDRINRIMALEHVDADLAGQMIRKIDKKRAEYNNTYSKEKWGVCSSYDLSVSTSRFGIDGAVKAILKLLE